MVKAMGERFDLPPCGHCGSRLVMKNGGMMILCKMCGRQTKVIRSTDARRADMSERPPCPRCGIRNCWRHGPFFECLGCGRWYRKPLKEF